MHHEKTVEDFLSQPDIQNLLKKSERERRREIIKYCLLAIGLIAMVVALQLCMPLFFSVPFVDWDMFYKLIIIILGGCFSLFVYYGQKLDPRETVMPRLAPLIDPNLSYEYSASSFPEWIANNKLVGNYNYIQFVGNHIRYATKKIIGTHTSDVIVEGFETNVAIARSESKFYSRHSYITEIKYPGSGFSVKNDVWVMGRGRTMKGFQELFFSPPKDHVVSLESNDFAKMFHVYCTDQVEARDLLNPHTMQALMHFARSLKDPSAHDFLFSGNSIYIRHNLKEQNLHKSSLTRLTILRNLTRDKSLYIDFYNEFVRFKKFVEDFDPFYRI